MKIRIVKKGSKIHPINVCPWLIEAPVEPTKK